MSDVDLPGEVEEEWPGQLGPFPLYDDRHYFYLESTSPFVHSGTDPADGPGIAAIQALVGTAETRIYDPETVSAVVAWRQIHGYEDGTYVDADLWRFMDTYIEPVDDDAGG